VTTNKPDFSTPIAENEEVKAGIAKIVGLLLSDDADVRAGVTTNLVVLALPGVRNLVLSDVIAQALSRKVRVRESAIRALIAVRFFAVERLKWELFVSQDRIRRRQLVELLGKVSAVYDVLVIMVLGDITNNRSEHASIRQAARKALGRIDPEFEENVG
jgi:uncharacterized protein YejL (UPF0352 family)